MKLAITADIHLGVPGRSDHILWALKRVRDHCHQQDIKYWINLGDLTHDRESLNIMELCQLAEFLDETKTKYDIEIIAFPGNHDMFLRNSWKVNSLEPLRKFIKCYSKVTHITIGGTRFWILPFVHYESAYMQMLTKIETMYQEGDVLLTHIGVKNATLNTCFLLKSWSIVDFTSSKFDKVYVGHFHSYQQVGNNLWYPGGLIPFKFDEGDVDHGYFIFDTETRTHEFISIWEGADRESPETPPQFMTIDDTILDKVDSSDITGSLIRIAMKKEYTYNQLHEIKQKMSQLGARDVRWIPVASEEDKKTISNTQTTAAAASSMFERYVNADKENLKNLSLDTLLEYNKIVTAEGDRRYEFTEDE